MAGERGPSVRIGQCSISTLHRKTLGGRSEHADVGSAASRDRNGWRTANGRSRSDVAGARSGACDGQPNARGHDWNVVSGTIDRGRRTHSALVAWALRVVSAWFQHVTGRIRCSIEGEGRGVCAVVARGWSGGNGRSGVSERGSWGRGRKGDRRSRAEGMRKRRSCASPPVWNPRSLAHAGRSAVRCLQECEDETPSCETWWQCEEGSSCAQATRCQSVRSHQH